MMKKVSLFAIVALGTLLLPCRLSSKVVLESVFSDNMVLQRNATVRIWGKADPQSTVSVRPSWTAETYSASVAGNGQWLVQFPTPDAGGPYSITFSDGESVTLNNVLIGEVWVCSGQSNMEMPMGATWARDGKVGVDGFQEELTALDKVPGIRLLRLTKATSNVPLESAAVSPGGWNVCTAESVTPFSATAYFFGKYLYETLGVPVGLIETCWGGTIAEAWTSEASLRQMHDFDKSLDILPVLPERMKNWETDHQNAIAQWKASVNEKDPSWMDGKKNWAGKSPLHIRCSASFVKRGFLRMRTVWLQLLYPAKIFTLQRANRSLKIRTKDLFPHLLLRLLRVRSFQMRKWMRYSR